MIEKHSLAFPTEIGSLRIEIETDLEVFKDRKQLDSDHYYLERAQEIKNELLRLNQEKQYNDVIWKQIRFKTSIGSVIWLYSKQNEYMVSIISPEEWQYKYTAIGKFILNTNGIWQKKA